MSKKVRYDDEQAYLNEADAIINFIQQCIPKYEWNDKDILDFGCGSGAATLRMSQKLMHSKITGVDVQNCQLKFKKFIEDYEEIEIIPKNLKLVQISPDETLGKNVYDLVYSWSVAEHINQKIFDCVFKGIYDCIKPRGLFFLQTTPLYYSAYGHHLVSANIGPYEHLILQDNILFKKLEENCQSTDYLNQLTREYRSLNKITFPEIKNRFKSAGFNILHEYTTNCEANIPDELLYIYNEEVLQIEQIVLLGQKLG